MRFLLTFIFLFLDLFFQVAFAQGSNAGTQFSFAPPANDQSLVYLANIFGVVDGVLAGSGSQIFGRMMGVFNTAVLAFSSIITMYILIVGTINTAQEGEFLGKQWSSIMVPLRITISMALLVPKASGYCMIQVFFMWVVIQGVGAADKIWNAALSYLNQGGQLIQQQISTAEISSKGAGGASERDTVYIGAAKMLSGIVCMYGLQQWIANSKKTCTNANKDSTICSKPIPDLLGSTDPLTARLESGVMLLDMPNMPDVQGYYSNLNGACGTIKWKPIPTGALNGSVITPGSADAQALENSRNIAVQTMYTFLKAAGMAIVNNDPDFNPASSTASNQAADYAKLQFGVALDADGRPCYQTSPGKSCQNWGSPGNNTSIPVLFTGNEFLNSILAYYGVMQPFFSIQAQQKSGAETAKSTRSFIADAQRNGWMYAGAYFFKLINLSNQNKMSGPMKKDVDSGLLESLDYLEVVDAAKKLPTDCDNPSTNRICILINNNPINSTIKPIVNLQRLISGLVNSSTTSSTSGCTKNLRFNSGNFDLAAGQGYIETQGGPQGLTEMACASTVYGFVGNSAFFNITGSSTIDPAKDLFSKPSLAPARIDLLLKYKGCEGFMCIPSTVGNFFIGILNIFILAIQAMVMIVMTLAINLLVVLPIKVSLIPMVQKGMEILTKQTLSPIVNIANMGAYFIQTGLDTYFAIVAVGFLIGAAFQPALSLMVMTVFGLMMPIITSWIAYFLSVGFTTAYYVPLVPYMIFLFGVIGWFFAVIESMIAAPLVALILSSAEAEGVIGKGETGIMILMNVFLRPSLMVIGFVAGIMMSTVGVWILSATFREAAGYLLIDGWDADIAAAGNKPTAYSAWGGLNWQKYPWANLLGSLFYISIFVSMYVTLTQKAFTLIHNVPDKVMRWIGGTQESYGQDSSAWAEETKGAVEKGGDQSKQGAKETAEKLQKTIGGAGGGGGGAAGGGGAVP